MIGVSGQFLFSASLENKKDFITNDDLEFFIETQESGNKIPIFELNFTTYDSEIEYLLNEGNKITITLGQDLQNSETSNYIISHSTITRTGTKLNCILTGMLDKLSYISNNKKITPKIHGIKAIESTASKNFIFDSNVVNINSDVMHWIQYNISDRKFINQIWMHTLIPNSFLNIAITKEGKFLLRDIRKKITSEYDWRFTAKITDDKDIIFDGDYIRENKTSFLNSWVGYKRNKQLFDLDSGMNSVINSDVKAFTTLTSKLIRNKEIEQKQSELGFTNSNVHSNFWSAYLQNLAFNGIYSSFKIKLTFQNQWKKITPLDTALFKEINSNEQNSVLDSSAGIYIINKVTRKIVKKQILTLIEMCRESINNPKGNIY